MRRHRQRGIQFASSDSDEISDESSTHSSVASSDENPSSSTIRRKKPIKCLSCKEDYSERKAGTCRECYEEAGETEQELKREIDDLKSKVNFLKLLNVDHHTRSYSPRFSDVVLVASDSESDATDSSFRSIPAHRSVLTSRSPVFKAMLENVMEESISGTIKICDVSYDALKAFVTYLYTAEACLDEHMACDLLVLGEKYQVKHLKTYCEKFLMARLNWENSLLYYAFAHQHGARCLIEGAMSLIMENMDKLCKREEYLELVEKDPRVVVEIYEVYLSKQVNTAASKKCKG